MHKVANLSYDPFFYRPFALNDVTSYAIQAQRYMYKYNIAEAQAAQVVAKNRANGLKNELVIGVAFDGTGLGTDNRIWGAEFLVCDYRSFQRRAHLREAVLPGAEKAIQEPWRLAAFWLDQAYQDRFLDLDIPFVKSIDKIRWQALTSILASEFSPAASSMGRLFDAAAALVLNKKNAYFEAELAMELEKISLTESLAKIAYSFKMLKENGRYIIDPVPLFRKLVADLRAKRPKEEIAFRFHLSIAKMIKDTCLRLRREAKINKVALSGGVFQNKLLLRLAQDLLAKEGFLVFTQQRLSPGDAGLSLGQAMIAGFRS
jgi:hydrogenase maturation protein HypF